MEIIRREGLCLIPFLLWGCTSDNYSYSRYILNQDWDAEIYNILFTTVDEVDNFKYKVLVPPQLEKGSSQRTACVEVYSDVQRKIRYKVNLDLYTARSDEDCGNISNNSGSSNHDNKNNKNDKVNKAYASTEPSSQSYSLQQNNESTKQHIADGTLNIHYELLKSENSSLGKVNEVNSHMKIIKVMISDIFEVNRANLNEYAISRLNQAITELKKYSVSGIRIFGVADSSGSYETNKVLAIKRAEVIKDYLQKNGYKTTPIHIRGSVENGLDIPEQRAMQRRFVLFVDVKDDLPQI